jgi:hypothetical protein
MIDGIKDKAKCRECGRKDYCKRIPVNELIVNEIKKTGKCPDFYPIKAPNQAPCH